MTPEQFCYWLQGFFEVGAASEFKECDSCAAKPGSPDLCNSCYTRRLGGTLSREQVQVIQDHLKEVFTKRTPNRIGDAGRSGPNMRFSPELNVPYHLPQFLPKELPPYTGPTTIC